jgi:hypothetical protein
MSTSNQNHRTEKRKRSYTASLGTVRSSSKKNNETASNYLSSLRCVIACELRRAGTSKTRCGATERGARRRRIRWSRNGHVVSGRIMRIPNRIYFSHRQVGIDRPRRTVAGIENSGGRRSFPPQRSSYRQMAARENAGLQLRGSHAGRNAEVLLVGRPFDNLIAERNLTPVLHLK